MSSRSFVLVFAALALLAGCDPNVAPLTAAPPTAVAEMDTWEKTVRLSAGIALAVECTYENNPCESATASSSDEAVVRVFPAFIDLFTPADTYQSAVAKRARSAFVLVGQQPGEATVTISTDSGDGDVDLEVTTVAAP